MPSFRNHSLFPINTHSFHKTSSRSGQRAVILMQRSRVRIPPRMINAPDVSVCYKKWPCIKNCFFLSYKWWSKLETIIVLSPSNWKPIEQKKSSDICSWKQNTKPETESAMFFRSIKLCADDKLFWTTEDTNSKVQNQKTNFDRLEHSAISKRLHI